MCSRRRHGRADRREQRCCCARASGVCSRLFEEEQNEGRAGRLGQLVAAVSDEPCHCDSLVQPSARPRRLQVQRRLEPRSQRVQRQQVLQQSAQRASDRVGVVGSPRRGATLGSRARRAATHIICGVLIRGDGLRHDAGRSPVMSSARRREGRKRCLVGQKVPLRWGPALLGRMCGLSRRIAAPGAQSTPYA